LSRGDFAASVMLRPRVELVRSLPRAPSEDRSDPTRLAAIQKRRAQAAVAGHLEDQQTARELFGDKAPVVRAAALGALVRLKVITVDEAHASLTDSDPTVRRVACELGVPAPVADFLALLDDPDDGVVEAAAFALGERGDPETAATLAGIATGHDDPLCRESAVAALGAIGDEAGRSAVLAALTDVTAIRRRAVIALAAFSGPDVDEALRLRLTDRDWQVRQAAEDVLGISDVEPR
jgi:HEAT repeat protein